MAKATTKVKTGFTTRLFYGLVSVTHYDQDRTVEIANIIKRALDDAGEPTVRVSCRWIDHNDGVDTVDSTWDGKKWVVKES